MPIDLICLDADDTLWHNMRHFNATHEALAALLKPFAEEGITTEALTACEIRNLKLYGYGAKSFTLSMIETAVELAGDRLAYRDPHGALDLPMPALAVISKRRPPSCLRPPPTNPRARNCRWNRHCRSRPSPPRSPRPGRPGPARPAPRRRWRAP